MASSQPAKVHADWPDVHVFDSPHALIDSDAIDLVVVPTPNQTHHALAKAALLAGKHVVVDKPFTLTAAEADDLARTAAQHQRVLSVFHNRRWDADFLTLQALLASGELGRITYFSSHFDRFRPQVRHRWRESGEPGSGLWFDLGYQALFRLRKRDYRGWAHGLTKAGYATDPGYGDKLIRMIERFELHRYD